MPNNDPIALPTVKRIVIHMIGVFLDTIESMDSASKKEAFDEWFALAEALPDILEKLGEKNVVALNRELLRTTLLRELKNLFKEHFPNQVVFLIGDILREIEAQLAVEAQSTRETLCEVQLNQQGVISQLLWSSPDNEKTQCKVKNLKNNNKLLIECIADQEYRPSKS